jgi:zinc transport system substrate-binding protein
MFVSMNKQLRYGLVAVAAIGIAAALIHPEWLTRIAPSSGKVRVTASFYPVAEFARQVGGDKVDVSTLVKPGVEPHDYDPTPQDLKGLYSSRLFVYNGAGLEKWLDRVKPDLKDNNVATVDASTGIELRPMDPHIWLDPVLAQKEVDNISAGLQKVDPSNASYYQARAKDYKTQLATLDSSYRSGLAQCTRHDIVTSHQAFGYLGSRYGLDVLAISGLSPDEEPTPQQLGDAATFAREHQVKYIFFETLVSPKLSETLAKEVGAQTLVFNPLEGLTDDEIAAGDNYVTVQQENLKNLRIALDCK